MMEAKNCLNCKWEPEWERLPYLDSHRVEYVGHGCKFLLNGLPLYAEVKETKCLIKKYGSIYIDGEYDWCNGNKQRDRQLTTCPAWQGKD